MVILILFLIAILIIAALNASLVLRRYCLPYQGKKTLRLAVATDLHACRWGANQSELLAMLEKAQPDALFIVGDLCETAAGMQPGLELIRGAKLPTFYVSGNHEIYGDGSDAIKDTLRANGVTVLEGNGAYLEIKGQKLWIAGVDDPSHFKCAGQRRSRKAEKVLPEGWQEQINRISRVPGNCYRILLAHRPDLMAAYRALPYDLVLCGHAHGGQVRLPGLINGLYAPHQGIFPPYAGGKYTDGQQVEIVSRGLRGSELPFPRVFNRPELVIVELTGEKIKEVPHEAV